MVHRALPVLIIASLHINTVAGQRDARSFSTWQPHRGEHVGLGDGNGGTSQMSVRATNQETSQVLLHYEDNSGREDVWVDINDPRILHSALNSDNPAGDCSADCDRIFCNRRYTFTVKYRGDWWRPQMCHTGRVDLDTCGHTGSLPDTTIKGHCVNDDNPSACATHHLGNLNSGTAKSLQSHCGADMNGCVEIAVGAYGSMTGTATLYVTCYTDAPTSAPTDSPTYAPTSTPVTDAPTRPTMPPHPAACPRDCLGGAGYVRIERCDACKCAPCTGLFDVNCGGQAPAACTMPPHPASCPKGCLGGSGYVRIGRCDACECAGCSGLFDVNCGGKAPAACTEYPTDAPTASPTTKQPTSKAPTQAPTCTVYTTVSTVHRCKGAPLGGWGGLGKVGSADDCAKHCAAVESCKYSVYRPGNRQCSSFGSCDEMKTNDQNEPFTVCAVRTAEPTTLAPTSKAPTTASPTSKAPTGVLTKAPTDVIVQNKPAIVENQGMVQPAVSGDPFTTGKDGNRVQFFLKLHTDTMLLSCGGFALHGSVMPSGVPGDHQQWFEQFRILQSGVEKLRVAVNTPASMPAVVKAGNLSTITVFIEGQQVRQPVEVVYDGFEIDVSQDSGVHVGRGFAEMVHFSSGTTQLGITSATTAKGDSAQLSQRRMHLDLGFTALNASSCTAGVLAEIWGTIPMSNATSSMLRPPSDE